MTIKRVPITVFVDQDQLSILMNKKNITLNPVEIVNDLMQEICEDVDNGRIDYDGESTFNVQEIASLCVLAQMGADVVNTFKNASHN
jgi:hypothetical protein